MLSTLVPVEEAEVIIVLGGDGFMLESVHRFQGGHLVYGRNRGTIGFLMNEFKEDTLVERINAARPQRLFPLQMTVTDSKEERIMRKKILSLFILIALAAPTTISLAEEKGGGGAAEMARKLQDPLANIKAVMTDNTIGFNTGDDDGTSYGFQFQPVYAIDVPDKGFTFLPRAVIPITGLEPGTKTRITGEDGDPTPSGSSRVWGLGDSVLQLFFSPHTKSNWKFGVGPQFSLATHTDSDLRGPDWGAGAAGVVVGNITENISFAGIVGNLWSFDGNFNSAMIQPMFFYNFESIPGAYLTYNAVISADWKADSDDTWTVPLGLSIGRTFDMGKGNGLDLMIGPYYNVVRPDGAADWMIRFGVSWIFP